MLALDKLVKTWPVTNGGQLYIDNNKHGMRGLFYHHPEGKPALPPTGDTDTPTHLFTHPIDPEVPMTRGGPHTNALSTLARLKTDPSKWELVCDILRPSVLAQYTAKRSLVYDNEFMNALFVPDFGHDKPNVVQSMMYAFHDYAFDGLGVKLADNSSEGTVCMSSEQAMEALSAVVRAKAEDKGKFLPIGPAPLINHGCCRPLANFSVGANLMYTVVHDTDHEGTEIVFFPLRPIESGEELTINYGERVADGVIPPSTLLWSNRFCASPRAGSPVLKPVTRCLTSRQRRSDALHAEPASLASLRWSRQKPRFTAFNHCSVRCTRKGRGCKRSV
jgi:hypothetical protein